MSFGPAVEDPLKPVADDVQGLVIADTGHFIAEESPDELLAALNPFLAPYRDGTAAATSPGTLASA
jgi:pimeloyl-ACP methyl ester carboxylesterase